MKIKCPQCGQNSEAQEWFLSGTVSQRITICQGEIQTDVDSQPTYFVSYAACPICGVEFELPEMLKLEWYEEVDRLYPKLKQQLEKL